MTGGGGGGLPPPVGRGDGGVPVGDHFHGTAVGGGLSANMGSSCASVSATTAGSPAMDGVEYVGSGASLHGGMEVSPVGMEIGIHDSGFLNAGVGSVLGFGVHGTVTAPCCGFSKSDCKSDLDMVVEGRSLVQCVVPASDEEGATGSGEAVSHGVASMVPEVSWPGGDHRRSCSLQVGEMGTGTGVRSFGDDMQSSSAMEEGDKVGDEDALMNGGRQDAVGYGDSL